MFNYEDINSYFGNRTHTFTEVVYMYDEEEEENLLWNEADNFKADFKANPLFTLHNRTVGSSTVPILTDNEISLIYYLLYSRYGNSHIASYDETRFKYNIFSLIIQYAPTMFKKKEIQEKLRDLDLNSGELFKGTSAIYNTALHDQTAPGTSSLDELTYINQQNTTNYKKSKLDAYAGLWEMLSTNVISEFLDKFRSLFVIVVTPAEPECF